MRGGVERSGGWNGWEGVFGVGSAEGRSLTIEMNFYEAPINSSSVICMGGNNECMSSVLFCVLLEMINITK